MHIAIFGGSFNPPHVGHMMACYYILEVHGADEVWMVPVFDHPFGKDLAPYALRVEMCGLAAEPFGGRVKVSRIEEELHTGNAPVYTVDLLSHLKKTHPADELSFVVGSDVLAEAGEWKEFDRVRELAGLLVLRRRGHQDLAEDHLAMLPGLSSSNVREAVRKGLPIDGLVPGRVLGLIERERLYRGRAGKT
ncbi:MAG: nicotinate-nicotinamide nucleotide adenylyltransferase [Myxococcota bacterium]|jgi:nicotinate-nucleotide adenylyltransferase